MRDVIVFINKMKIVFDLLSDEELDMYNDIYNRSTEEFISWINQKYEEYLKEKIWQTQKFLI